MSPEGHKIFHQLLQRQEPLGSTFKIKNISESFFAHKQRGLGQPCSGRITVRSNTIFYVATRQKIDRFIKKDDTSHLKFFETGKQLRCVVPFLYLYSYFVLISVEMEKAGGKRCPMCNNQKGMGAPPKPKPKVGQTLRYA